MSLFSKRNREQQDDTSLYDDYRDIRDEAWRILAENGISELPVDIRLICETEKTEVYSYEQSQVLIQSLHLQKKCIVGGCLVLEPDGRRILLYDDAVPNEYRRFLIACGLGHFVLGHTLHKEKQDGILYSFSDDEELRAGIFAGRLLAPLSVLWAMGVQSAQEIRRICLVPKQTAEKRYERLKEIDERNFESGMKTGQGTLFLSGYERAAYRNFSSFTEEYRLLQKKF